MKESGIGRENGLEAFQACALPSFVFMLPFHVLSTYA